MPDNKTVIETLIFHLKSGVENASFVELREAIRLRKGYIRQYWGRQVENDDIAVGVIEWDSEVTTDAADRDESYSSITALDDNIVDLEKGKPLAIYTTFPISISSALSCAVTELAFYSLPTATYTAETQTKIDTIMNDSPSSKLLHATGFIKGGDAGWVFRTKNAVEPVGMSIALAGMFGYDSVEDHRKWRDTPEHARVIKDLEPLGEFEMAASNIPGGGKFVEEEGGMFHVGFLKAE